jgi:hypothetical protein
MSNTHLLGLRINDEVQARIDAIRAELSTGRGYFYFLKGRVNSKSSLSDQDCIIHAIMSYNSPRDKC